MLYVPAREIGGRDLAAAPEFQPRWELAWDANRDGATTISDISQWFWYWLYAPGDFLILILSQSDQARVFFELTPYSYGSWTSLAVSIVFWLGALGVVADHL